MSGLAANLSSTLRPAWHTNNLSTFIIGVSNTLHCSQARLINITLIVQFSSCLLHLPEFSALIAHSSVTLWPDLDWRLLCRHSMARRGLALCKLLPQLLNIWIDGNLLFIVGHVLQPLWWRDWLAQLPGTVRSSSDSLWPKILYMVTLSL